MDENTTIQFSLFWFGTFNYTSTIKNNTEIISKQEMWKVNNNKIAYMLHEISVKY